MQKVKILVATVLLTLLSSQAFADIEISAKYFMDMANPSDLNAMSVANIGASYPAHKTLTGFDGSAIYFLPAIKLGLGVQYMTISDSIAASGITSAVTATRISPILAYRFLDDGFYLGATLPTGFHIRSRQRTQALATSRQPHRLVIPTALIPAIT